MAKKCDKAARAIMGSVRRALPFLVLLLAGCGRGHFGQATPVAADTLVYPLQAKNTTLDPGKVNDAYMAEVLQNVVEGLVAYDEKNRIVPWLAERWDVTDGGRTYVFHLRRGVRFSNGRPLVADDFRWTWERTLAKEFASPAAGNYLQSIQGVPQYMAGKARSISGVKAIDDATLRVTLDRPRPYFLGNLTVPTSAVMAKEAAGDAEATTVEAVVGTGPFRLAKLVPDAELDLDANPGYWGGKPSVSHVRRPILIDPSARLSRFLSGDLDYLELDRQSAQNLDPAKAKSGRLRSVARPWLQFLVLGEKAYPPFRDPRVRQAMARAIDRPRLVGQLLAGYDEAKGLVPHGVPGYQSDYGGVPFDPGKARALLAEGGIPRRQGPAPDRARLHLDPRGEPGDRGGGRDRPPAQLGGRRQAAPHRMGERIWTSRTGAGSRWAPSAGRPTTSTPRTSSRCRSPPSGPQDKEGFEDAQVDALCSQADSDADPRVRADLYRQAERRAIEQVARIPIFMMNQSIMTSSRVKRLPMNAIGVMPLLHAEVGR